MVDQELDRLRAKLARLTGSARNRPLIELGQKLFEAYWRSGAGRPESRPHLAEAATVLDEAYGYFAPGDFLRGQVAALLGLVLGARYGLHGAGGPERERAIGLLDEALSFPRLPFGLVLNARLTLGQLLLHRVLAVMQPGELIARASRGDTMVDQRADADRAVECLRAVRGGDAEAVAGPMIEVAEAMRNLMDAVQHGPAAVDFSGLFQAITALQKVQQRYGAGIPRPGGLPPLPGLNEADDLARSSPLDRPVAVVHGDVPAAPHPERWPESQPESRTESRPESRRPAGPTVSAAELRAAFRERLGGAGPRVWPPLLALLDAEPPGVDLIDGLLGLATRLTAAPGSGAENHLLLATALYLRSRVDSGGWGDSDGGADRDRAAHSLLAARDALPGQRADVLSVAYRLAGLLDEVRTPGDLRSRLADGFTAVTGALRSAGAGALAYPQPTGLLLLVAATGRFEPAAPGAPRPERLLVVGDGQAGPASAASYVRSAAQVVDLAARRRPSLAEKPLFVGVPGGDRLRDAFYPRGAVLDRPTVDQVRAGLPASMLHLGCGVTGGGELELAGGRLPLSHLAAGGRSGGVAVLPPATAGLPALIAALLATCYAGVVAWRTPVPPAEEAVVLHVLHQHLAEGSIGAVRTVREWALDRRRKAPPGLPAELERAAGSAALTDAELIHHGL